ncbi:hypothetical protein A4H97_29415 [Niastella yeongjuensis]|uniref:Resolvase n=1 Tax=Niastella yeongjuensis TaxID=354355 RepID=A0A1V9ET22_9BACT|nr:recombinase family protein [Niastella yeongjuensis]OQP49005.1 hypothetical protein A4H97_29415 [Niastella yeongjuensis]SEP10139.1 Site-specific DNA recombinase [Niastella yeongjuensis]
MTKIADLYIRVSTKEQKLTGFSQGYQEDVLKTYCTINSLEIGKIVFEDYSAKTFNRPAWNRLFAEYKSKKLTTPRLLLVTKWDRFSRNTGDAYYMIRQLALLCIEVLAIEQPLDTRIPESKIMMAFFLALPQVENERRGLNIKQGLEKGIKEGRWMGLAPVGYINKITKEGSKYIEPIEPYATLMKMAFNEIAKGILPVSQIYQTLTKSGFTKGSNCFWRAIRNPVYCGKILLKQKGAAKPVYILGQHRAIISESLFLRVQQVLVLRKKHQRNSSGNDHFPLRGFLGCPICSKFMTGSGSTGKRKIVYYYYHCQTSRHPRIRIEQVHQQFKSFLEQLIPIDYFDKIYQKVLAEVVSNILKEAWNKKVKLTSKIEILSYKIDKIKSLLLSDSIDVADYRSMKNECDVQKTILEEALITTNNAINRIMDTVKHGIFNISKISELYEMLSTNEKKEIINYLFPHGIIYDESCFSLTNISSSLQLIYTEPDPFDRQLQTLAPSKKQIPESALIDEVPFFKELITFIISDNLFITFKQAKEIINFFNRIAELSLRVIDIY